jgi:hypothetical protein
MNTSLMLVKSRGIGKISWKAWCGMAGLGWKDGRIWIPEDEGLWKKVMRLYHDSPVTGHLGTSGTLELVLRSYWSQNLPDYVK